MNITIRINTDNAAFDGRGLFAELRRCLARAERAIQSSSRLKVQRAEHKILDTNGNTVGEVTIER